MRIEAESLYIIKLNAFERTLTTLYEGCPNEQKEPISVQARAIIFAACVITEAIHNSK